MSWRRVGSARSPRDTGFQPTSEGNRAPVPTVVESIFLPRMPALKTFTPTVPPLSVIKINIVSRVDRGLARNFIELPMFSSMSAIIAEEWPHCGAAHGRAPG